MPRSQEFDRAGASWPLAAAAMLLSSVLLMGCSGNRDANQFVVVPVTGQVTFDGRPASGAVVVFHPKGTPSGFPAPRALVDRQGNFVLTTYRSADGAPVGEYLVTVELRPLVDKDGELVPGPNVLPPQYSAPQTSNLVARVVEGANTVPIQIVR